MIRLPRTALHDRINTTLAALAFACAATIAVLCWWPGWWTEEELRDGAWVTVHTSSGLANIVFFAGAVIATLGALIWLGSRGRSPQRARWGRWAVVSGLVFTILWSLQLLQAALGIGEWTRVGVTSVNTTIYGPGWRATVYAPAMLAVWLMIAGFVAAWLGIWNSRKMRATGDGQTIPTAAEILLLMGFALGIFLLTFVWMWLQAGD